MSRQHIAAEMVKAQARALKMPGAARAYDTLARQARDGAWTYEEYLHEVLTAEVLSRNESAIRHRMREARFPDQKTLEGFDFAVSEGVQPQVVLELARCEWVRKAQNLILAGPIGTGKTHLAIALGTEAAKQRQHVLFTRAADLVRSLVEARDQRELSRIQRRLGRVDLLIIDELGFVPFDRTGGELLFNTIAARYERKSVLVTTNLAFSEWPKVFADDEKLTTALLDRLADRATVLTRRGRSFRMRRRQTAENGPQDVDAQGAPPARCAPSGDASDARLLIQGAQEAQGRVGSIPSTWGGPVSRRPGGSLSERPKHSKSRGVNVLSAARFFLFGARDIWYVVGVPVYLASEVH